MVISNFFLRIDKLIKNPYRQNIHEKTKTMATNILPNLIRTWTLFNQKWKAESNWKAGKREKSRPPY